MSDLHREDAVSRVYEHQGRATRVVIDLDSIAGNVRALRANQGPGQGLMAVVKADGYGHGAVPVARTALAAGAERLGVATVGEAVAVRSAGIDEPIVILGPIDPSEIDMALECRAELTIGSQRLVETLQARAESLGRPGRVHVKVDTGMHRFGSDPAAAPQLVAAVKASRDLEVAGVCTHLATADDPDERATERQLELFSDVVESIRASLPRAVSIHASNSAASVRRLFPEGSFERVGIALYGLPPGPNVDLPPGMRPAMSVITRLTRVHSAARGEAVSYGRTYAPDQEERLGLLPIGYADGYRRGLSNRAWISIRGARCPVRGRVCMDQTVVGSLPDGAGEGDTVGLLGPILEGPSADELAGIAGTISYEILAGISSRIPRYYIRGGRVVAIQSGGRLEEL
jgi:alanine racemase